MDEWLSSTYQTIDPPVLRLQCISPTVMTFPEGTDGRGYPMVPIPGQQWSIADHGKISGKNSQGLVENLANFFPKFSGNSPLNVFVSLYYSQYTAQFCGGLYWEDHGITK